MKEGLQFRIYTRCGWWCWCWWWCTSLLWLYFPRNLLSSRYSFSGASSASTDASVICSLWFTEMCCCWSRSDVKVEGRRCRQPRVRQTHIHKTHTQLKLEEWWGGRHRRNRKEHAVAAFCWILVCDIPMSLHSLFATSREKGSHSRGMWSFARSGCLLEEDEDSVASVLIPDCEEREAVAGRASLNDRTVRIWLSATTKCSYDYSNIMR